MFEDGGHKRRKPRGQALLQRCPDEVFRPEAEEGLLKVLVVGEVRKAEICQTSGTKGQYTLLNVGAPSRFM